MDEARMKQLVGALVVGADTLTELATTASRNKHSISGSGHYGDRFHEELIKVMKVENALAPVLKSIANFDPAALIRHLATVKSTSVSIAERGAARRQIRRICETEVVPSVGNLLLPTQPTSEPVLAAAVLTKAPSYLQRILVQANGCYEKRWYEASSVMIRKLVETSIIEVYEHHRKEAEIRNKNGDYLMLGDLVTAILGQTHWSLQRETKKALPDIKRLGDRAAHNRRYEANRQDIDPLLPGLRAAVDDLLHLAGYK
jgi:hypothetical protein